MLTSAQRDGAGRVFIYILFYVFYFYLYILYVYIFKKYDYFLIQRH